VIPPDETVAGLPSAEDRGGIGINYYTPPRPRKCKKVNPDTPSEIVAFCVPGAIAWCGYFGSLAGFSMPTILDLLAIVIFPLSVFTALCTVAVLIRWPLGQWSGHVRFNLAVTVFGELFTFFTVYWELRKSF
jgi:hypothetical protein